MDTNTFKLVETYILEKNKIISQKSFIIEELEKQIKIQWSIISTFKNTIDSYAKMNEELNKTLEEKNKELEEKNKELEEKNKELEEKNTAILCIKDDLDKCKKVCEKNDVECDIINGLKLKLIVTNSRLADALLKIKY